VKGGYFRSVLPCFGRGKTRKKKCTNQISKTKGENRGKKSKELSCCKFSSKYELELDLHVPKFNGDVPGCRLNDDQVSFLKTL